MFQKVENFEHYLSLIDEAKKKCGILNLTNILYFGKSLKLFVEKGLLFCFVAEGVCFIDAKSEVKNLYYIIRSDTKKILLEKENYIVEFMEKNEIKAKSIISIWQNSGFSLMSVNWEMVKQLSEEEKSQSRIKTDYAKISDFDVIFDIWEKYLNTKIHPLPSKLQFVEDVKMKRIVVIKDNNDNVVGVMRRSIDGAICSLERIVVVPEKRGKGIAGRMIKSCYNIPGVIKIKLFVNDKNLGAIKLYLKLSFEKTGKYSYQLIKNDRI